MYNDQLSIKLAVQEYLSYSDKTDS